MPTYEYACTKCGHRIEVTQRIDDPPLTECERCGGDLRKVFHPAGIVFKGSGFYATDSRAAAKKDTKKEKVGSGSPGSSGEGGSKTSESKKAESTSSEGKSSTSEGKSSTSEGKSST